MTEPNSLFVFAIMRLSLLLSLVAVVDATENATSLWTLKTQGRVWSGPAVSADGGTIFVGSNDYKLYADLDLQNRGGS